ncbi:hypothetical protein OJAV_G00133930 [Oryzias javanicus]|uniref:NACHT domain-containing protein n=1 Tax=Oryzias javanicus TaxID=123683 RepID=A0A437CQZ9_ORYJA|nr:hypothetical protein OJAV_G00133930 [Oryzias javanicus]
MDGESNNVDVNWVYYRPVYVCGGLCCCVIKMTSSTEDKTLGLNLKGKGSEGETLVNLQKEPEPSDMKDLQLTQGAFSWMSSRSDLSKDLPVNFRTEPGPSNSKDLQLMQEVLPLPFSCLSMKSDMSKDLPVNFGTGPSDSKDLQLMQEVLPLPFSCLSMKSDMSKDLPVNFGTGPSDSKDLQLMQEVLPLPFSCLSMKSDMSKDLPVNFGTGPSDSKDLQLMQEGLPLPFSCLSMKSDMSKDLPVNFRSEPRLSSSKEKSVSEEESRSFCGLSRDVLQDSGLCSCPQSAEGSDPNNNAGLKLLEEHQISLKKRCEHVNEGTEETGREKLLNRIYTELFITEGLSEDVNTQHEVRQLEAASKISSLHNIPIRCNEIFKVLPDQHGSVRVVLTSGVAGAGKSFLVQKFTLDWAEGLENQDISAVVPLSFRELNLIREEQHSLLTLIQMFHPSFQKIPAEQLSVCKLLFVFDGLDESRLSLDFNSGQVVSDVSQKSSVNVLLTNLIQGRLLSSALVWITSRPAAANQIPPSCVSRVTEVRGFTDSQKEEYFRRRFKDEDLSSRIISHIKGSRSLHVMCGVPIFCWITAVVLEDMLTTEQRGELPKTLTDLYSHFLMVQTKRKKNKYQQQLNSSPEELTEANREVLLKLGRLALEHLENRNLMFYEEDLEQCGLDVTEASVFSGVCTEIFIRECLIFQKPVYCFVHLSVQEFLSAVYMFHCYTNRKTEPMENFLKDLVNISTLDAFLDRVMEKSLQSQTGHLDLFVRFLHGLSVESNQRLLGSLLGQTENRPETIQAVINNLKKINCGEEVIESTVAGPSPQRKKTSDTVSPDRRINIFHCLMEMKDLSVHQEIQEFLNSKNNSAKELSETHCSALAYILQMSEEVLDELDLLSYKTTEEGKRRLIPAVRNCRKFKVRHCGLSDIDCEIVASALKSKPSHLTELNLGNNELQDSAIEVLCSGLESPNCRLEVLRLEWCSLSGISCAVLSSALLSNPFHLRELTLNFNRDLQDSGMKHLCCFLESPDTKLIILSLIGCGLSEISCAALASALRSNPSHLRELDLSDNDLLDSGVQHLCGFLESPDCRLNTLRLKWCCLTKISYEALFSALKSNPSHLTELDLRAGPDTEDSDFHQLQGLVESPDYKLQTVRWRY